MPGKEVVSREEMVKKIEAACLARRDDDFVIIARTDALAVEGIDATLERIRAYVAAGADAIFPDAVKTEDQIARVVEAAGGKPVSINMGFGIRPAPDDATDPAAAPQGAGRAPHQPATHAAGRRDQGDAGSALGDAAA